MGLFGAKPKLRPRASAFGDIDKAVGGIQKGREAFIRTDQANLRDVARGRTSDLRSITQARSADVAQAASAAGPTTTLSSATDAAINRGRGLSRVINATKTDFDQSLLQERIAAVKEGQRQQGQGLAALTQAGSQQDILAGAEQEVADAKSNAKSELFGVAAGIATDQFSSFFSGRKSTNDKAAGVARIDLKNSMVGGTGSAGATFNPQGVFA